MSFGQLHATILTSVSEGAYIITKYLNKITNKLCPPAFRADNFLNLM